MSNNSESAMDISTDAPVQTVELPRVFYTVGQRFSTARHAVEGMQTMEGVPNEGTTTSGMPEEQDDGGDTRDDGDYQDNGTASGYATEELEDAEEDLEAMDGMDTKNIVDTKRERRPPVDTDDTVEGASTVRPRFGPARPPVFESKGETEETVAGYHVPVPEGSRRVTSFGWVDAKDFNHEVFASAQDRKALADLAEGLSTAKDYFARFIKGKRVGEFPELAKPFTMPLKPSANVILTKAKAAENKKLEIDKVITAIEAQINKLPAMIIELGIDLNLARRYREAIEGRRNSQREAEHFEKLAREARHKAKFGHLDRDRQVR